MDPEDPVKYDYALFGLGVFEGFQQFIIYFLSLHKLNFEEKPMNILIKAAKILDLSSPHHNTIQDIFIIDGVIQKIGNTCT